jgi:hypothetical protein
MTQPQNPQSPPNPEKKWRRVDELLKKHEDIVNRVVESKKQTLIDGGFRCHGLKDLVALGYSLALEELEKVTVNHKL